MIWMMEREVFFGPQVGKSSKLDTRFLPTYRHSLAHHHHYILNYLVLYFYVILLINTTYLNTFFEKRKCLVSVVSF